MGAGILPVTIFRGTILFLLGKERYNENYWCDFGGSSNHNEAIFETAIREGYEELDGFLGTKDELKNIVNNNFIKHCYTKTYTTLLFYVDYDKISHLPYYFNNHRKFIDKELVLNKKEGIFEKSEIKFYSKQELIDNIDNIRPFYRELITQLIKLKKTEIQQY